MPGRAELQARERSVTPVLTALRHATRARHEALEVDSDIEARLRDVGTRPDMVARFLDLHERAEAVTAGHLGGIRALGCSLPGRSVLIRADLVRLGVTPPAPVALASADTLGEALGWLYVIEGSMLGGRVMRRSMTADGIDQLGLEFLDPCGQDTGRRWRAFLAGMEAACASGQARCEDVVIGAQRAFDLAARLLVAAPTMRMSA